MIRSSRPSPRSSTGLTCRGDGQYKSPYVVPKHPFKIPGLCFFLCRGHRGPERRSAHRHRPAGEAPHHARRSRQASKRRRSAAIARRQVGRLHRSDDRRREGQARHRPLDGELGRDRTGPPDLEPRRRERAALEPGRPLPCVPRLARRRGGEEEGRAGLAARPERAARRRSSPTSRAASATTPGRPTASGSCSSSSDPDPDDEPEKKEGWKRKTKPPIVIDRYHFKQDRDGYLKTPASHLSLFDVEARKAEQLTTGAFDDAAPAWSPDGTRIAFVSKRGPDPDRTDELRPLTWSRRRPARSRAASRPSPGPDGGRPAWSPDGRWIAYLQGDEPRFYGLQPEQARGRPGGGRRGDGPDRRARPRRAAARSSGRRTARACSSSSRTTGPSTSAACRPRAGPSRR